MYIGTKKIKQHKVTGQTTYDGSPIVEVTYQDGTVEWFSRKMFDEIKSKKSCTVDELRDKRVAPVVQECLSSMREWGLKISELGYFSALLQNSLEYNRNAALTALWGEWMPRPLSADDVDLVAVDRVLTHHGE